MNITALAISRVDNTLTIKYDNRKEFQLSFEYLRVLSPATTNKQQAVVSHKKTVGLSEIENVGKHGYRFIFDDQHSAIYSPDYLELLIKEHDQRWQQYLNELKVSGHSREAMINITQL